MDSTLSNENWTTNFVGPSQPHEELRYHDLGNFWDPRDVGVCPTPTGMPFQTDDDGSSYPPSPRFDVPASAARSSPTWIPTQGPPYPYPTEPDPTDLLLPELSSQMQADRYIGYCPQRPTDISSYMPAQHTDAHVGPARQVISTNAVILASERRRLHPHRFFCHHCPRGFTAKHNYDRHIAAHSDTRPYLCHCGSTFTTKSELRRHLGRFKQHPGHAPSLVTHDMIQGTSSWLAGSVLHVLQAEAQDNSPM